ncbi:MAG: hypothetical protein CMM52_11250 [Rhodospirillaceae bacterium]|nr:hypothetical protein [Rhodospirillaceae bacterium]|tara:strand:- start:4613 stop:5677 length:1065 start_codon:yes stop_codon:yes gene_type:complete
MAFELSRWRKTYIATALILAGLGALNTGIWFAAAHLFERGIENWAAAQRAQGWTVEYKSVAWSGFPWRWQMTIEEPMLSSKKSGAPFHWSGPFIDLNLRPWSIRRIGFHTSGEHRLGYGTAREVDANRIDIGAGHGDLLFAHKGNLKNIGIVVEGANFETKLAQTYRFTQLNAQMDLDQQGQSNTKPHQTPIFSLNAELFGLTLPKDLKPALGQTISRITLTADFLGTAQGDTLKQALSNWAYSGGSLDLTKIELGWSKLDVSATGTLALDSDLQPIVAMSGKVSGYGETLDQLADSGIIKPGTAMVTRFALRALANSTGDRKSEYIGVSFTIQDGYLHVGPVKLIKLPRIIWD